MRLGIVGDVHDHADHLAAAIEWFSSQGVDRILTLGDTIDVLDPARGCVEVARMLRDAGVIGVWGNHDIGLCIDVSERVRARADPLVLEVMATMQPQLVVEDCLFSHRDAAIDPYDALALWGLTVTEDEHDLPSIARRAFAAAPHRCQFVGHHHRWWAATPAGPLAWAGDRPLDLSETERYFVVVGALVLGDCAILDTTRRRLEPHRVGEG